MNDHCRAAADGLNELRAMADQGVTPTDAASVAVIQSRAILALAEEQAKTNAHLRTANLLAYAQLCNTMRDGAKFAKARKAAEKAMKGTTDASAFAGDDF